MLPRVLAGVLLVAIHCAASFGDEGFDFILKTKTANVRNAGTDEPVYFVLHYVEVTEVPDENPKRKPKKTRKPKQIKVNLNNKGNDREVGAVDTYKLHFKCPLNQVTAIEIGLESGGDAWFLDGMQYVVARGDMQSRPVTVPFSGWLSADKRDAKSKARQYYWFRIKPPRLYPKPKDP